MERTGWSLAKYVAECVLERWLVSDHRVCGWLSVASRLFIEAAATPPREEGNAPTPHSLVIHSHLLTTGATLTACETAVSPYCRTAQWMTAAQLPQPRCHLP